MESAIFGDNNKLKRKIIALTKTKAKHETFNQVPDGSRLEIWVTGDLDTFVSAAYIIDSDGIQTLFNHHSLVHQEGLEVAGTHPIQAPLSYLVRIENSFHQKGSASVHARIVNPEGEPMMIHGSPSRWSFWDRHPGAREACGLLIKTAVGELR